LASPTKTELISKRAAVKLIGSDHLDFLESHDKLRVNFLNLRGDQRLDASLARKVSKISNYYAKLIRRGQDGILFKSQGLVNLAKTIVRYFASDDLFANLSNRRQEIRNFVIERHSWDVVGQLTISLYANLLRSASSQELPNHEAAKAAPLD
jgi:hypothetical protein